MATIRLVVKPEISEGKHGIVRRENVYLEIVETGERIRNVQSVTFSANTDNWAQLTLTVLAMDVNIEIDDKQVFVKGVTPEGEIIWEKAPENKPV